MNRFGFYQNYTTERLGGKQYVVKSGDSLYKIAKRYGITINDLVAANNITSSLIYPNQVLLIPNVNAGALYLEEYIVQPNDTLEIIGEKLNVAPTTIAKYNDITKLVLAPEQVIKIPKEYKVYVVTENDTLTSILTQSGLTLEELVYINQDTWLKPGTVIYLK